MPTIRIFISLLLITIFPACALLRPSPNKVEAPTAVVKSESMTSMQARLSISSENIPELNGLKAQLRYQKDSMMWLNVNLPTGILVLKAAFYPDSLLIYSRIENELSRASYPEIYDRFSWHVDYRMLESILLNVCLMDSSLEGINLEESSYDSIHQVVVTTKDDFPLTASHLMDTKTSYLVKSHYVTPDAIWIVHYSDFKITDHLPFPEQMSIEIRRANQVYLLQIKMDKIEVNKSMSFPFNIPNNS